MADWELQLTAAAQQHKRASYSILLAQEKVKFPGHFLLNVYQFNTIVKMKSHKLNHHKSGTIHNCLRTFSSHQSPLGLGWVMPGN